MIKPGKLFPPLTPRDSHLVLFIAGQRNIEEEQYTIRNNCQRFFAYLILAILNLNHGILLRSGLIGRDEGEMP